MNVLVTGGAGYLGSVLIPKLLARSHRVRVVDIGYFGIGHLRALQPGVDLRREDLRRVRERVFVNDLLDDIHCIVHLAAISNDPSAELYPELTDEMNFRTTVTLAQAAKDRGIPLVFSSSCSVYGEGSGELTEDSNVNPLIPANRGTESRNFLT